MLDISEEIRLELICHLRRSIGDDAKLANALGFDAIGSGLDRVLVALFQEVGSASGSPAARGHPPTAAGPTYI